MGVPGPLESHGDGGGGRVGWVVGGDKTTSKLAKED